MSDNDSFTLGRELMAPIRAAGEALRARTGLSVRIGPRPDRRREMQLEIRPEEPFFEGIQELEAREKLVLNVAFDSTLVLAGRGSVTGESFFAEALQAHTLIKIALRRAFEVPITSSVPDNNLPDGFFPEDPPAPVVTVDAEPEAGGTFFETPDPESSDWEYDARWLLTCRYQHVVDIQALTQNYNLPGYLFDVHLYDNPIN